MQLAIDLAMVKIVVVDELSIELPLLLEQCGRWLGTVSCCDAERGWRAQIARAFGVPPELVSDWFAKRKTPTWKQELRIQLFVESELRGKGQ